MNAQQLAEKIRFMELIHAPDERFPIDAVEFVTP